MEVSQCPRCRTRFRGELATCPVDGESLQRLHDPLLGRTIAGRYLIEDKIGTGGMGVVYRASHQAIGRDVAIKFLHMRYTRDLTSRKRFLGEARAANQIDHENIIDITDFGETDDGLVYLVMEYLEGRSLDREIAGRPLHVPRALRIATQIASGLGRAHELDVIHRDVKPGNVFLVHRREADLVKLLDFGIARFERELRITDHGTLLGTPEYIAPEQVRTCEVSPHTDLYSLGCVLFEMLVGEPPFRGTMSEVLVKQIRDAPIVPSQRVPSIPSEVDRLVLKLLAKAPEQRHRDAYHLIEELRALLERMPASSARPELRSPQPASPPPAAVDDEHPGSAKPDAVSPAVTRAEAPERTAGLRDAAVRPTLHVPLDRDDWRERVAHYRRQLNLLHPNGDLPRPVSDAMQALERIVAEASRLRTALHGCAQELADNQNDLRGTRLRIGRALDELASDESKLDRAHGAELAELTSAESKANHALHALLARPPIGHIALTRGNRLSDDDALLLQGTALALDHLREAQLRVDTLRREHQAKRAQLEDIRFQIAQLKERLSSLNAASVTAQTAVHERAHSAEARLRGEMERLVSEAEQVSLYLRTHAARAHSKGSVSP